MVKIIKQSIVAVLLLALTQLATASAFAAWRADGVTEFTDTNKTISLTYPATWTTFKAPNPNVALALCPIPNAQDPNFILTIVPLPASVQGQQVNFDQIEQGLLGGLQKTLPDAKIVERKDATMGGEKARRWMIVGHLPDTQAEIKAFIVLTVHHDTVYSVSLQGTTKAAEANIDAVDVVLKGLHFTK